VAAHTLMLNILSPASSRWL